MTSRIFPLIRQDVLDPPRARLRDRLERSAVASPDAIDLWGAICDSIAALTYVAGELEASIGKSWEEDATRKAREEYISVLRSALKAMGETDAP